MAPPYRLIKTAYKRHDDGTEQLCGYNWVDAEAYAAAVAWAGDISDADGLGTVDVLLDIADKETLDMILKAAEFLIRDYLIAARREAIGQARQAEMVRRQEADAEHTRALATEAARAADRDAYAARFRVGGGSA